MKKGRNGEQGSGCGDTGEWYLYTCLSREQCGEKWMLVLGLVLKRKLNYQ